MKLRDWFYKRSLSVYVSPLGEEFRVATVEIMALEVFGA